MNKYYFIFFIFCIISCRIIDNPVEINNSNINIALIGDSRIAMFPIRLIYYNSYNYGIVGYQTQNIIQHTIPQLRQSYDYILLSIGINDINSGISIFNIIYNIKFIIEKIKNKGKIIITTVPGVNDNILKYGDFLKNNIKVIELNNQIKYLKNVLIIDLAKLLCNIDCSLKYEYDDGSGIHYNLEGYRIFINELKNLIVLKVGRLADN